MLRLNVVFASWSRTGTQPRFSTKWKKQQWGQLLTSFIDFGKGVSYLKITTTFNPMWRLWQPPQLLLNVADSSAEQLQRLRMKWHPQPAWTESSAGAQSSPTLPLSLEAVFSSQSDLPPFLSVLSKSENLIDPGGNCLYGVLHLSKCFLHFLQFLWL